MEHEPTEQNACLLLPNLPMASSYWIPRKSLNLITGLANAFDISDFITALSFLGTIRLIKGCKILRKL
ncbi:hypothetical protein CIPAW_07G039900 [Carya illinoinensis]|uniref:Uncharacterized protein n=1 Tax=Carya illinoinensis TaxID=32201 RepID=A0A8T1PQV7_CARIL|nr:hypothetical protein CIPAW_07G039900 [Carya illinoinensis]